MSEKIILKRKPKIEMHLCIDGFELLDEETKGNSGFFAYSALESAHLKNAWFPSVARCLRVTTWVLNGVPFFTSAADCKKASLSIQTNNKRVEFYLTSPHMANKARAIKSFLDNQMK